MTDPRRAIPPVERLLDSASFASLQGRYPRARVLEGLRQELASARDRATGGGSEDLSDPEPYARAVEARLRAEDVPSLRPVINATGVILHTNLGRAPLPRVAIEAMKEAGAGYSNLEYDLGRGERGSRYHHCAELLCTLTGAEAALVVNNNAAALVLALNTLALGRAVLVSRGELVEIGGSFRVPDILARAGARLEEVGSTNRTRAADYRNALSGEVAAILKVHRSNFRMVGFTEEVGLEELSRLASGAHIPVVQDLGSGLLMDGSRLGLHGEPTVRESLSRGADLVCFSGDKLLGGPQAGILIGRKDLVERMRANPLCRALRVDKVTLAGLEATLRLYRDPERAVREIPALALLALPAEQLRARAESIAAKLRQGGISGVEAAPADSMVGGGTCPDVQIPSWSVRIASERIGAGEMANRLRARARPVVARVEDDRVVLDLRTVPVEDDEALLGAVREALLSLTQ
jgi:L-seryl-tRNA(Ser) seleniumtransferase